MSEFRKVLNEEEEKIMKKKIITKKVKKRWLFHSFDVYSNTFSCMWHNLSGDCFGF